VKIGATECGDEQRGLDAQKDRRGCDNASRRGAKRDAPGPQQ